METPHVLGGVTYDFSLTSQGIPEPKKTIAVQPTYEGVAIFQWPAIIQGAEVPLFWKVMPVAQYDAFNALYQSMDVISWNPQYRGIYQVVVSDFKGDYIEVVLNELAYRANVEMKLHIRSGPV